MDSIKGRYNGKLQDQSGPPGPVPFQGIGTRLRRSRSKDHSSDFDNLSTAALEIANLRQTRNNPYDHGFGYLTKGGTLERPKRLYNFSNASESSTFIQQPPIYGSRYAKNMPSNVYEDSRLLGHQYEEPHLILDHLSKDPIYELSSSYSTRRRSKDTYLMNGKHLLSGRGPPLPSEHPGDLVSQYHSYAALEGVTPSRPNTTVIPPSKLFAKSFTTSTYNTQSNNRLDSKESSSGVGMGSECSPKSQTSSSVSSKQVSSINSGNVIRSTNGHSNGCESDSSTKADSGLLLTRTSHELSSSSSSSGVDNHLVGAMGTTLHRTDNEHILSTDRTFNDLASTQDENDSPPKLCLTSSSQSSVMHTYANPFQNGCGGSSFSEDTTGPIIPDMNTLRPSQLLKNSFAGSGPPPSLHSSSANRNVISCLANRFWSHIGRVDQKTDLSEHRCSWRVSTLALIVFVFILLVVIIAMFAMNSSATNGQSRSESPKVPCIVVEDLDSTSSSHLSSSSSSSFDRSEYVPSGVSPDHSMANCPLSLPRDPLLFKEIRLTENGLTPFSFRLAPYSAWTVWFNQMEASLVNFQFYAPLHVRLVLLAHKNEPPSLASHQIFQVISEEALSFNRLQRRTVRESQLLQLQSMHYFEQGSWYLTLVNDLEHALPLVVNMSSMHNVTTHCPNNCHNHGHCHLGKCQCFPGFIGHDCADNVCPVFCGGHGQYLQGSCRCEAGWKGRECTIRIDECEVADCNGNGVCIEGACQCRTGSKGEHCELADCLDPQCSEHGICFEGMCICKTGWSGNNCSLPNTKLHQFFPNCSNNGVYDFETGLCACYSHFSGSDCSKFSCSLECGTQGYCQDGRCQCLDGWSGAKCDQRQCDSRCLEHGKCVNGSCVCEDGWMGKYCTLDGCPNLCSKHGRCIASSTKLHNLSFSLENGPQWSCRCEDGWGGRDCSAPQETNCNDEIDNDNDGLVDCADSECCRHEQCGHQSLMCITSPDPLDILLRKQPPSPISSFFQKVHFLIEDGSVQSYAQKDAYSEKRVSVIRGQVVSKEFNGLIGVRVSVATDPQFGFTLTRSDGWFDILVNGGGIVTLQFQRNPFYPIKKSVYVAWNDIGVIQNPIVMYSVPDNGNDYLNFFNHRASSFSFYSQFSLLGFGDINWSIRKSNSSLVENCAKHDYEQMRPVIRDSLTGDNLWLTKNTGVMCGEGSCILAETQTVHEKIPIGASQLNLIYQSSLAQGYLSTLHIQLTPLNIPNLLRFVLVRILIEGNIHEKIFEADPDLKYSFAWNKRNVYKQKVYGFANAKVYVGYVYHGCGNVIWNAFHTKLRGYDMEISELGSWNLDIHHRYNVYDSLFQRGDGQIVYFQDSDHHLPLSIESIAGSHLQPRPFVCTGTPECSTNLQSVRFFSLVTLTSAPDGSVFVGDANLIRRIMPDARVQMVYQFKSHSNRQTYDYYIAFNSMDGFLYISDPDKLQIVRIQISDKLDLQQELSLPDVEVVVGTGERCLPHDRNLCGDGKTGPEVQLTYPKGLAFGVDGSLFFADGNVIRVLDTSGYVHRIVGDWNKRQWKPASCKTTRPANEIKLHWPTSLAVNPVDGALYFVDNFVLFKLNHEMHVSIVAGLPSFCLEETVNSRPNLAELNCHSHKLDPKMFSYCGEDILFGSITFTPNGVLYISDISRQSENRIFTLLSDTSLVHVAGYKSHNSQQNANCSVERCSDISGQNCTCLISDSSSKAEHISVLTDRRLGVKAKLFSISALTATGDGTVYVADEGSLRLYRLRTYAPQVDDQLEIKILSPNLGEMYTFNQYGQHMSTRSTVTGRTLFSFHYNLDNSFGKLTDVVDVAGNKISFIRDPSGALHTIESSFGFKCFTIVNKLGLLEQVGTNFNGTLFVDYYPNGLIRSRMDSSTGATHFYLYDKDGRVSGHVQPSGTFTRLDLRYDHSEEILSAHEIALFEDESNKSSDNRSNWLSNGQFELNMNSNSQMKLKQRDQTIEMVLLFDGSIVVNTSNNVNGHFSGKASMLSNAMLPMQAQMFPLISRCRIEHNLGREQSNTQSLDLSVEYGLKMKSSIISAVEKFVAVNNSLALKLEYDWKANREIYYNQSQRPILYLQFDENGRPIQWVPNIKDRWLPHSLTFDKAGHLASWQDGARIHGYVRDRAGRLIEVRQMDHFTRYSYSSDAEQGHSLQLPSSITLRSGHKYLFEHDSSGRLEAIITPKSAKHEFNIKIILGYYRFAYCPPIVESKSQLHSTSHCYLIYLNEQHRPAMKILPYDHGKIIYKYGSRVSFSKDFSKELLRSNEENLLVDQVIYGNGLVERWYDRKSGNDVRGIWRNGNLEFAIVYKYTRNSGLLKHQSYQFGNIQSVSQLTFNYRYDNGLRLRTIQSKLGSINLPALELSYNTKGQIETMGNFRYFERNQNETLIGDGVALFVRRYESTRGNIRHASVTIADKEVFRVDYIYDSLALLVQTRTFMRHLGANKMRMQNFTYDLDGQLVEVQGREHWRFVYDFNGNLVTFLYLGNRIDIDYDSADRVRNFGKGQDGSPQSGSSPYVTDLRGYVVQRGEEHLSYSHLGQLLSASRANRYEVHFIYDYHNRLVVRRDHQNNVTQYFYGNPRKPNLVTHAFNNADGRVLSLIYDDHDDSLLMLRVNNENFYVACDQAKSPLLIFDHRGQVVKEIHRSPYGHVLFDSNPSFHLPVDFQGGIPDSLTNLVHFANGRIYDTLTGRWMTPQVDQLLQSNLLQNPRVIHQYQFALNDPINPTTDHEPSNILSSSESQALLRSQTESLVEHDINIGHLRLLKQIKFSSESSIRSYFFSSLQFIIDQLGQFASFKTNYYSKLTLQDWTSARSTWNLISTNNALFSNSGILLTKNEGHTVQVYAHARVDVLLLDFLNMAVNGSGLVDTHLVMGGQDHFFMVREHLIGSQALGQLNKYQHIVNYTVHTGQSETDKKPVVDVRISMDTVVVNVRFGTSLIKERERVLRIAKKYAINQRLSQERMNILQSRTGLTSWTEDEKQFILSAQERNNWQQASQNGPLKVDYYHSASICAQLVDDAANIVLRSKRHH